MPMTSLNVREPASARIHGEMPETACEKDVQRMKDFVGLHRFQAPVADDFARGMVVSGQDRGAETKPLSPIRGALVSVILGLRGLCSSSALDGQSPRAD
ncbi:hypothetical protein DYL61_18740 [Pseudomonas nabeulensis]|uniref:Uncharacterized protein n=1 Tax=Pseudomonas nabeulensis TaxID=2293833 RepID=A0A4Z0AZZ7_9PSED|nr:hypothetical protein [Pseudomonas nabeulensis]TFY91508.1 hypothetical protein DYL61_18740 [Pseudomonas nabeulensis]